MQRRVHPNVRLQKTSTYILKKNKVSKCKCHDFVIQPGCIPISEEAKNRFHLSAYSSMVPDPPSLYMSA